MFRRIGYLTFWVNRFPYQQTFQYVKKIIELYQKQLSICVYIGSHTLVCTLVLVHWLQQH